MKIVVIGGGPAGMIASIAAAKNLKENGTGDPEVILIEKNEKLGKKLFITGKGRCNVTNACDRTVFFKNIVSNPKFMFSSFNNFSNVDLYNFIETYGCPLKVERGERVFPVSDKSYDIIDAFKKAINFYKVKVLLDTEVKSIKKNEDKFVICARTARAYDHRMGEFHEPQIYADKVIIATGGLAYPQTGSTGDGYKFAGDFDLDVVTPSPSLVPLDVLEKEEVKKLSGLTLKNVSIKTEEKFSDFGDIEFNDDFLTGPIILTLSSYIKNLKFVLTIDLKPALDEATLDARLRRELEDKNNKNIKDVLLTLLPHKLSDVFLYRLSKILNKSEDEINSIKLSVVDKNIRHEILHLLKNFTFTVVGKRTFDEAIITKGGVSVKEIDPKTMESKKVKGLYFAGEVLDVDCLTGGFNITIACSTGYTAGIFASKEH